MKEVLKALYNYKVLQKEEAYAALRYIATGESNESQSAAFLSAYIMRRPTVHELEGFREVMEEFSIKPNISSHDAIDIVGTGGDGKNTFNISTLSALVVAASGLKVIKHGNYAASSVSGSSNVLEQLGYAFTGNSEELNEQLAKANICFLHAPLFHPAMKHIAPVRKNIGVRTFFNLLGPLINPAKPKVQLLGVSSLEVSRLYHYLLQEKSSSYAIVHSMDGYDEISLTAEFKVTTQNTEAIYSPGDFGFEMTKAENLQAGSSVEEAASIFLQILKGNGSRSQNNVVAINSAFAIHCAKPELQLEDCISRSQEILASGKAYETFKKLISAS